MSTCFNELKMDTPIDSIPLNRYPRPSLKRDSFLCLNGKWDDGALVPYPLGSSNCQVDGKNISEYTYKRTFTLSKDFIKDIVLLHFGAVDQVAVVYIDDLLVGTHEGGYLPFEFDITAFCKPDTAHTLSVKITDTLSNLYPYGKQKKNRGGMWYTPISGIWQSAWIESVSFDYIKYADVTPSLNGITLDVGSEAQSFHLEIFEEGKCILAKDYDNPYISVTLDNPRLWSPDSPFLYTFTLSTKSDKIESYFGLRTVTVSSVNNVPRILLNGKPFFFHGVLDQGYFPEGIFTPNAESDYEEDIKRLKALGINTIRKHIKIEPEIFYEACDRLGMLVFQDMVNNGRYSFFTDTLLPTIGCKKKNDMKNHVKEEIKASFEQHMEETLVHLYNFPCIVYYTIFNEGWGQFDSDILYQIGTAMDPSRIWDSTSGWFWQECSDVDSYHVYFRHFSEMKRSNRPVILSEFGGFVYKDIAHSMNPKKTYGYGKAKSPEELTDMIVSLYETDVIPAIKDGLCGSIYTQATDVEDETNGFYTYDRKVCKVNSEKMLKLAEKLKIN